MDYYNLGREQRERRDGGKLSKEEEMREILDFFEFKGFHTQVRFEWVLDEDNERIGTRVIKDLFFISPDQIRLARRFVSSFIYETDATFNTNRLHLPLSVIVGITNTRTTFPIAICYITSESATSFEFV